MSQDLSDHEALDLSEQAARSRCAERRPRSWREEGALQAYGIWLGLIGCVAAHVLLTGAPVAQVTFSNGAVNDVDFVIDQRVILINGTTVNLLDGGAVQAPPALDAMTVFDGAFDLFGGATPGGRIAVVGNSESVLERGTIGVDAGADRSSGCNFCAVCVHVLALPTVDCRLPTARLRSVD